MYVITPTFNEQYGGERYRGEDTPFVSIPRLLFCMARPNFLKISQYACALLVVPRDIKSTRMIPFPSQKTDAMIFRSEKVVRNFLVQGKLRMAPLHRLSFCFWRRVGNPNFITCHYTVKKFLSLLVKTFQKQSS